MVDKNFIDKSIIFKSYYTCDPDKLKYPQFPSVKGKIIKVIRGIYGHKAYIVKLEKKLVGIDDLGRKNTAKYMMISAVISSVEEQKDIDILDKKLCEGFAKVALSTIQKEVLNIDKLTVVLVQNLTSYIGNAHVEVVKEDVEKK